VADSFTQPRSFISRLHGPIIALNWTRRGKSGKFH